MPFLKLSLIVFALASSLCDGYTVLPFGATHGDSLNPKIDDGCGEKLALPDKFSFYSKSYDSIWVCNNGILSFSGATSDYTPKAFPSNYPWICIFWADIDNRVKLADGNDIYWRMDQKRSTLEYVNGIITRNGQTFFHTIKDLLVAKFAHFLGQMMNKLQIAEFLISVFKNSNTKV